MPVIFAPVEVTTNTLGVPPTEVITFPPAVGMLTFELPLANTPRMLPPVILPVVVIVLEPAAMVPMMLPPVMLPLATIKPSVPKLPTFALPVTLAVPVILAPVAVTTRTLALPPTETFTFPLAVGMFTFDVPFAIPDT